MKNRTIAISIAVASWALAAQANAGCVKGAIVGGIAGHLLGHGGLGAAAGCAYGAHESPKRDREEPAQGRSSAGGRSRQNGDRTAY